MDNNFLLITDLGDPSVGLWPISWRLETPFNTKNMDFEILQEFRQSIKDLYSHYCEGRLILEYDFELNYKDE